MSLRTIAKGEVTIVNPSGMLLGGDETLRLEAELRDLIAKGRKKILLDLGTTNHLSSTAIGVLVSVHLHAANQKVAFCVCNVDKRIRSVLAIFKIVEVLNVCGTREEALEALSRIDVARAPSTGAR